MADSKTQIVITAKDETQAAIRSAQTGMQQLADAASKVGLGGFSTGIAALAGGAAFTKLVTDTIHWAAALDDLAEKTGASVESLGGLAKVASISGTSIETVEMGLIRLSKALAGADEEAKGAGRALSALGLDPEKLRAMDAGDALKAVAESMAQYRDGIGKTALAQDIFGKSGAQLLPYLKDLSENLDVVGKITTEQAAAAEALEKAWRRTANEGGNVAKGLVLDMLPAFGSIIDVVKGAKIGIAQFGSSLAVVANDIATAVQIIGVGIGAGFTQEGRDKIGELLQARSRFVEAANEDLQQRAGSYKSTHDEITRILADGSKKLPTLDYTSKGPKAEKAGKAERALSPEDQFYGGYQGAYNDFKAAIMRAHADAQAAADTDVLIEKEKADRISAIVSQTTSFKIESIEKEIEEANKLLEEKLIDQGQFAEFSKKKLDEIQKLKTGAVDQFAELQRAIEGWGKSSADAIAEFAISGKMSFSSLVESILKDIAKMAIYQNVTKPMFDGLSGMVSGAASGASAGGGWGALFGGILGMFGGGRASGGPVNPGQYYVVGENGPEILVPNAAGTVVPNGGGAGGQIVSNVTVNVANGQTSGGGDAGRARDLSRQIEAAVRQVILSEQRPGGMLA